MGITQSKEYAEPEWYADIWLVIVWVTYFAIYIRTLARRKEPHIYVANWYYMAFILVVAILHIVNNLAVPVSLGHAKSYSLFSGVQDAMTQWWYGHNAVAFFLTAGFLGMMYYYLPKRAGRPIYSYRLSIISFWGITFMYMWAGSHHLHYTALPQWVQTLGMTFSVMLLVPSWASAGNALLTLNGAWHKVRDDATLRFMMVAAVFYGLATFEGSFMAIRPVNSLSHYTDWTVGHVHAGALGWVAMITFGSIYALVPWLWKRERMYSAKLVEVHFWLALSGTLIYVFAMWNSGIIQGLMWRTYNESGTLAYSFIDSLVAMHPYYIARAFGGLLFLLGAIVGSYNIWMTIRGAAAAASEPSEDAPEPRLPPSRRSRRSKRHVRTSTASSNATRSASCSPSSSSPASAAFVEIAPLFTIDETVERRRTCGSTRRSNSPAATSTSARAAMPAIADDPHAARRGRALRSVLAGGGIQIRPSDAVGLEADRPGPRARRRQIFRRLACRASEQSARRRAGIGHAGLSLAARNALKTDDLGEHLTAHARASACPIPTR